MVESSTAHDDPRPGATDPTSNPPGPAGEPGRPRRRLRWPPMAVQILIALAVGILLGFVAPAFSEHLKIVGDAFIRLIQMSIVPLIFPLIVLSISRMESAKDFGRLAGKSLLYFEVVTTAILALTLALAFAGGLGNGVNLDAAGTAGTADIQKSIDIQGMLLDIIPKNIFEALGTGNLLAILFFAVFFGLALSKIGARARPVAAVLDGMAEAMFQVVTWVVRLAPPAVVAFVAYNTAHYGWQLLVSLSQFVLVFYLATLLVFVVVFPLVCTVFRIPYLKLLRSIGDLIFLSFVTRSSEVVLAPLIKRLDDFGVDKKISSFTMPLGYSFNADGATMYEGLAVVFLAHAYGIELTIPRLLSIMLVLMVLTKGIAGVPSSSIVVLFAASAAVGLPAEGVAILLAIDFVVDMARTALNVGGNSVATCVVARSEGLFRSPKPAAAGGHDPARSRAGAAPEPAVSEV